MLKKIPTPEKENWEQLQEWDKKYFLRPISTAEEYVTVPIVKTEGNYLVTNEDVKILDFMSVLHCAGCGAYHPKIAASIKSYADRFGYVYEGGWIESMRPRVGKFLIEEAAKGDFARVGFANSGSEAVEYVATVSRLYTQRPYILTRDFAYHGWTTGAVAFTRIPYLRNIAVPPVKRAKPKPMFPPGTGMYAHIAPPPFCYRCPIGHDYPGCKKVYNGLLPCVKRTKDIILTLEPEIGAMITEVVFGSCGVWAPPPEYIPQIRQITNETDILWIDDEVICGFGRTGKWFGYQLYRNAKPDLLSFAKNVTGSHIPGGGALVSEKISKWFDELRWWHASTFASHPLAMAAAYAALTAMKEEKLIENAAKMGKYLEEKLEGLKERHKSIGFASGVGLIWGIEFVKDRETKEPFIPTDRWDFWAGDVSKYPSKIVGGECFKRQLLVSTFAANNVTLMPSLTITEEQVDFAIEVLDEAIKLVDKMV